MKFYLKVINPIIAIVVLGFSLWAGISVSENDAKIINLFKGGFSSYFLAKGLFCSSSLFILGKILEMILKTKENQEKSR